MDTGTWLNLDRYRICKISRNFDSVAIHGAIDVFWWSGFTKWIGLLLSERGTPVGGGRPVTNKENSDNWIKRNIY